MARVTPPYFFDEFLLPIKRDEPTPRERALGLTVKDLDWLHRLYYATDHARRNPVHQEAPMVVESLLLQINQKPDIPLAGAFIMSPSPDGQKALLYTPYDGLEVFDSRADVLTEITERLKDRSRRADLLRLLSIAQRATLDAAKAPTVAAQAIEGPVMQHQEQAIQHAQLHNVQGMLDQLRRIPGLPTMLDTSLAVMARAYFPSLDHRDTRMNSFALSDIAPTADPQWLASVPLSEALLHYYLKQSWPIGQTRTFTHPKQVTSGWTPTQVAQDQRRWESVVEQTAGILSKLLGSLLQTYWNEDIKDGHSRLELVAQTLSDTFRAELLLKRQQGILSAEDSQQLLAMFLPDAAARTAHAENLRVEKIRVSAPSQHYVDLAGTLMISNSHAYLYTQTRGLQVLKNMEDLNATLISMLKASGHEDELLNFLSLDERNVLLGLDPLQIIGVPINGDIFTELAKDIAAKQLSNMEYALGLYRRSDGQVNLEALLDCALDVRGLIDHRLHTLDAGGRWSLHPITSSNGRPSTVQAERAKQQWQQLNTVEQALASDRAAHPTLRRLAAHALNAELDKHQLPLMADEVNINTYATAAQQREERAPLRSLNMVEHFIERLAHEAVSVPESTTVGFYSAPRSGIAKQLNSLSTTTFNTIIDSAMVTFANHDVRPLPQMFLNSHRAHLRHALMLGLRSEAELRRLDNTLRQRGQEMLDTVLRTDSLTRVKRHALNGFLPDAYGLTLMVDAASPAQPLANCLVLTERGGTDPQRSGQAVLWTPRRGHEVFNSIQHLRETLQKRLQDPIQRLPFLENLPNRLRTPHQAYTLGPLQRIDDDLLDNRLQSHTETLTDNVDTVLAMNLGARRLQDYLDVVMQQAVPTNLPRAMQLARAMANQQALPVWLGMAAPDEQILHAELLEQYRVSAPNEQDYLHGITPLNEQVSAALVTLLEARFPGLGLHPDNILVPIRKALNGNTQSLTDFAQRHLPDLQPDEIHPRSRTATPLPATLDGTAVVQMVQQLDLKSVYQTWLTTHLLATDNDAHTRRQRYCRQLPWQLLQYAHEEKLEERISATAWGFIQQVFDMPDAVARAQVSGVTACIRPLQLVATAGASVAEVQGVYLIGPQANATGPWVLYAPYSPHHVLREYAREADLLNELTTPGPLQEWILQQLDPPHQATYRNLLAQHRRDTADIRLGSAPILGNILMRLFKDNVVLLTKMLACQFDKQGAAQWGVVGHLLHKGVPNALTFMAGKLAYPLVVWRSYKLFKASSEHLQQHRWGEALRTFVGGVAELASLRKALNRLYPDSEPATTFDDSDWTQASATTTLATLDITAPQRTHLQTFEQHEVALTDLRHDPKTQVYHHVDTGRDYVPVAGKVYPARNTGTHWRIHRDEESGPGLALTPSNQWVLDLRNRDPRFGKTMSRFAGRAATRIGEWGSINIEAVGMTQIATLSSWKAQCINEALNVATYYTVTCKRNILNFALTRDPLSRLGRFFTELFGVHALTPDHVGKVETRIDEVLNELVNPTLINPDSIRFVTGTARYSPEHLIAFTLPDDIDKKIYLLDRFFAPDLDMYQNRLNAPFNIMAHARATTLIHELTHLVSDSEDLAYLDSMRPFTDLINVQSPRGRQLHAELDHLRLNALSTQTPGVILFKVWDDYAQQFEELGRRHASRTARTRVLNITGAKTLDDARQVFMSDDSKRINIILANADSIAYMITHLGRELDPGA